MTHSSVLEWDSSVRDNPSSPSASPPEVAARTLDPHGETLPPLDAARAGSPDAMGVLWDSCRSYLLLVANSALGDDLRAKVGASDLVQETFAEAQRAFPRFEGRTQQELLAWLSCILHNKLGTSVQQFRGTAKRDIRREQPLGSGTGGGSAAWQLPVRYDTPARSAVHAEERARVNAALAQLDSEFRQVVVLRVWQQRTFDDIAASMQRTVDTVRTLFVQAIAQLQTLLAPRGDDASSIG